MAGKVPAALQRAIECTLVQYRQAKTDRRQLHAPIGVYYTENRKQWLHNRDVLDRRVETLRKRLIELEEKAEEYEQ